MKGIPNALEAPIAPEKYSDIADSLPKFVQAISEHPNREIAEQLLDELVPFCVDLGVSHERNFVLNRGDIHINETAAPAFILNRAAFITYIEELPEEIRDLSSIQFLDIKNLRASANIPSETGDAAADIIVNEFARTLVDRAHAINSVFAQDPDNHQKVTVGRYGGDEFVLLFENFSNPQAKESAFEFLTNEYDGVTSKDGYYLKNGQIEKHKVELKDDMPEIWVPKEEARRKCFLERLSKGLIVSEEEIEDILALAEKMPVVKPLPLIPENATLSESMDRWKLLLVAHPEFEKMFSLTSDLFENINESLPTILELERFLYNIAYDRLLGEYVSNMATFPKHFLQTPYTNIHVTDIKIKELNDNLSLASGDDVILATWYEIAGILAATGENFTVDGDLVNAEIFKRGGLFITCDNAEPEISPTRALQQLTKLSMYINNTKATFNIATATWTNTTGKVFTSEKEVSDMLGELINESERTYFRKQVLENLEHPEYFDNTEIPSKETIKRDHIDISNPEIFIRMFLYGKRIEERTAKAIAAVDAILMDLRDPEKSGEIMGDKKMTQEEMEQTLVEIRQKIKTPKS